jgi:hypothetical protein
MKHIGNLIIDKDNYNDYSELKEVTGDLYIYSQAKLDNLTTVGGYLYIYSQAKLEANFLNNLNYKIIDNNLFVIESTKNKNNIIIYKGYNIKSIKDNVTIKEYCYVAENNDLYAHGKTIKKAIEDLNYKVLSEKLKHEPIYNDTIIDINYYRIITGACEFGVKSFIESNNLKESYRADELLIILEKTNAYGLDKFKSLLTKKNTQQ